MTQANFASGTVWTGDNLPIMRGINSGCATTLVAAGGQVGRPTHKRRRGTLWDGPIVLDKPPLWQIGRNMQLLCTHCNKSKGGKTMAEWRAYVSHIG